MGGLRLDFDAETMEKLGLNHSVPKVGDTFEIKATAVVINARAVDGESSNTSLELQITDMEVKEPDGKKTDLTVLYPNSSTV